MNALANTEDADIILQPQEQAILDINSYEIYPALSRSIGISVICQYDSAPRLSVFRTLEV